MLPFSVKTDILHIVIAPSLRGCISSLSKHASQEALPGVSGNRGKGKGHLFQGNKDQNLRGTKTILGNREHKKTNFRFLGNRGTSQFISGEQWNGYHPWEGLSQEVH